MPVKKLSARSQRSRGTSNTASTRRSRECGRGVAILVPTAARTPSSKKPPVDLDTIAAFCQKYQVKTLSLFGSILRSDFNASSDVDVLVDLGDRHIDFHEMFQMVDRLEAIFGRRVDMVEASNLNMVDDIRRGEISSTARVIYEEDNP
jgi:predicted nucleotidyltransferase